MEFINQVQLTDEELDELIRIEKMFNSDNDELAEAEIDLSALAWSVAERLGIEGEVYIDEYEVTVGDDLIFDIIH